jgi:hypothetical protein
MSMEKLLKMTIQNRYRPIVKICDKKLTCLVDTGANINVFTLGSDYLKKLFPNAERIYRFNVVLDGFGKGEEKADLYKIKRIKLTSDIDDDYLNYEDVLVACCDKAKIGAGLVLSAGMFDKLNIEIRHDVGKYGEIWLHHSLNIYNGDYILNTDGTRIMRTSAYANGDMK